MRNFIMFFDEKEGTTALMSMLARFGEVSVVQLENDGSLEPFDRHACGPMAFRDLQRCLDLVLSPGPTDLGALNRLYRKTAERSIGAIDPGTSVGFKMRYRPPSPDSRQIGSLRGVTKRAAKVAASYQQIRFSHMIKRLLKRHRVAVLIAVRQDLLRWALSKYHGDGTGNPGHLQFKLAGGAIRREEIGKIRVDCDALGAIISQCEKTHAKKRRLQKRLQRLGVDTYPVLYEAFLSDRTATVRGILNFLEIEAPLERVESIVAPEGRFKKVHSDDIRDFVENHGEVMERFGNHFSSWS